MERVLLAEIRRRLEAHGLAAPRPDANLALVEAALAAGRSLARARLVLHGDPGIGLPAFLLDLDGPAGREVIALSPGPRALALLERALATGARLETDLLAAPAGGPLSRLAAALPAPAPAVVPAIADEEERLFARVLSAARPAALPELLAALLDVLLEEVDAERGIVALARDGVLAAEAARLRGGKDLPESRDEIPRRVFERVALTRRAVFVEDVLDPTLSLTPSASVLEKHVKSFLAAPVLVEGEVAGIVYVDRRDRPVRFDARARALFERLAQRLALVLAHALEARGDDEDLARAGAEGLLDLVGGSKPMRALYRDIERLARQDVDVLILGETGTGKELIARALHRLGRRHARPLETLNCAALPETLLDAALFGHVRGAFTGADRDRPGLFAAADQGTLFLDEVGEMPAPLQAKLLRAIELGEVRPVGSAKTLTVDVRLLAATHRDLARQVEAGSFRADLFYRLGTAVALSVPPLADRKDDVALLARRFLADLVKRRGLAALRFAPAAIARLESHPWPGNVRELRNVVFHSALACDGETIRAEHLVFAGTRPPPPRLEEPLPASAAEVEPYREHLRRYLARVHELAGGNITRTSELLGEPRSTVREWLTRYGLVGPEKRRRS